MEKPNYIDTYHKTRLSQNKVQKWMGGSKC